MSLPLARLREKYLQMKELRTASGEPDRAVLQALAREFPGSLAELDRLPPEELDSRIATLDRLVEGGGEPPLWVRGWQLAHPMLRGALLAKAWLGGLRAVDASIRDAFAREVPTLPYPEDAHAWIARLDEVADPPDGRLVDVVFRDVAAQLGVESAHALRVLLMPRVS